MEETETCTDCWSPRKRHVSRECASNRLLQRSFKEASTLHGLLVFKTCISGSVCLFQSRQCTVLHVLRATQCSNPQSIQTIGHACSGALEKVQRGIRTTGCWYQCKCSSQRRNARKHALFKFSRRRDISLLLLQFRVVLKKVQRGIHGQVQESTTYQGIMIKGTQCSFKEMVLKGRNKNHLQR